MKKHRIFVGMGLLGLIAVLSALFLTAPSNSLDWAHSLDKDDIEKVELYWMEEGQEDATYLLDENQRATLCVMLNNLYGEETENVPPSQGTSAQYSIYRTDGTVETISFLPLNEDDCFFRLGWDGFMGDQYQMDDWMGLTETVVEDVIPTTRPDAAESGYYTSDTTLYYDNIAYSLTEQHPSINAIRDCTMVGDYLVVEGHMGPENAAYCLFNTKTCTFDALIFGTSLTWHSDDITTAVYAFWNEVYTYDGTLLASYSLSEYEIIDSVSYSEDFSQIEVMIFDATADDRVEYIDLTSAPDQWGVTLTADQLSYFNDTYFNGATGQNWNLANQFLHSPFDLPVNIDLFNLFYHGAGADYAMSEDGEYDAVAQAYGFDGWMDIPTDVTAIPKTSMDYLLEQYAGIDLLATNQIGLDSFKYLEQYDCYYNLHGDTNYYGDVEFVSGTQTGDRVALSYYNSWQQADYILTLVDYGGGDYKIYANLPAIIEG